MPIKGWTGYAPFYVANEMNLMDGERIEFVDKEDVEDVEDIMRYLEHVNGDFADAGPWLVDTHVVARSKGVPVVAILKLDTSLAADALITHSNIKEFDQLQGKKIAYQRLEPSHTMLLKLCAQSTKVAFDKNCKNTSPKGATEMFQNGEVQAAISYDPYLKQAENAMNQANKLPAVHRLYTGKNLLDLKHPIVDILVVREDFLARHPERVKSLIKGWFRALEILVNEEHPKHEIAVKHFCAFMDEYAGKRSEQPYDEHDFHELTDLSLIHI